MEFCAVGKLSLSQEQCSRSTGDYELLGNLTLSIQGHLKRLKITGEIESEGRLIAVRLGIFDEQSKWGNLTVCSHHRKLLGVQWAPKERHTCQYPMHQGKGKPERSITLKNSKDIQKLYGKILQVGTGKVKYLFYEMIVAENGQILSVINCKIILSPLYDNHSSFVTLLF